VQAKALGVKRAFLLLDLRVITGMRRDLPTGTVTFLFTDIEGSTKLLQELGAEAFAEALGEHQRLLREACPAHNGVEVDTQGDAFFMAFSRAGDATAAAADGQRALSSHTVHVRIGLHTGAPHVTAQGYVGKDVHKAGSLQSATEARHCPRKQLVN
jgi:class 3 adenylate cyclase